VSYNHQVFVFGHVGIGRAIVGPLRRTLPVVPFIAGALLPDLVDKSLYYAHFSDFISCTRTFGHTGLFLAGIALVAWARGSWTIAAVAVGVATHHALDASMDMLSRLPSSEVIAFTWPFAHRHFASYHFSSPIDQLSQIWKPRIMITEAIGLLLLAREFLKWRSRPAAR